MSLISISCFKDGRINAHFSDKSAVIIHTNHCKHNIIHLYFNVKFRMYYILHLSFE